jgi:hypothetical protein
MAALEVVEERTMGVSPFAQASRMFERLILQAQ